MKKERELAELIFDTFRESKCKKNQIVIMRKINLIIYPKLNPKEQETFCTVLGGLIFTGFFTYENDKLECLRLTEKGYDYIYDAEKIELMQSKPWIIPTTEKTDWDKAYFRLWEIIGPQDSATYYIGGSKFYKFIMDLCDDIPPSYSQYIENRRSKEQSTSRVDYYKDLVDQLDEENRIKLYINVQLLIEEEGVVEFETSIGEFSFDSSSNSTDRMIKNVKHQKEELHIAKTDDALKLSDKIVEFLSQILEIEHKEIAELLKYSNCNLIESSKFGSRSYSTLSSFEIISPPVQTSKLNNLVEEKKKVILNAVLLLFPIKDNAPEITEIIFRADTHLARVDKVAIETSYNLTNEIKESKKSEVGNEPKIFISYSWDSKEHEEWILKLAKKLRENGVDAILDKWDLGGLGKHLPNFMENSISKSQRVICVMTPNYKKKADMLDGGVGYEYSIITSEIFNDNINTSKFIPLFRFGKDAEAIPTILKGRKYVDMRDDFQFEDKFFNELLRDIHNVPKYIRPPLGKKTTFD